jgi:preprotein translocase subunit SecD
MTIIESSSSPATRAVRQGDDTVFVRRNGITTTSDIAKITVAGDDALASIQIDYTPQAADRLFDATSNGDGLRMAFVVDNEVWLAFTWEGPDGIGPNGSQISLLNGMDRAQSLVEAMRACTE